MTWLSQVEKCHRSLATHSSESRMPPGELARISPILFDSVSRPLLLDRFAHVTSSEAERHAGLAYVNGMLSAQQGDLAEATRWLTRALVLTSEEQRALRARIGLELAQVFLGEGNRTAADAILAQVETREEKTGRASADRLLLEGLLCKEIGDHRSARPLYREALARSNSALTPLTRVLALVNLAIALEHTIPSESVALCKVATDLMDQERLHPHLQANLWNILGYTSICAGNLPAARVALSRALQEAVASGAELYGVRARFNLAIVDELEGDLDGADARLSTIQGVHVGGPGEPMRVWAAIRRSWIALERGDPARAMELLQTHPRKARSHWEAVDTVCTRLAILQGDFELARKKLVGLVTGYRDREDFITAMTLLLWSAHVEDIAGHTVGARKFLNEAWEIGSRHGFVVAPSWWSHEIVATARSLGAGTGMGRWVASLHTSGPGRAGDLLPVALTTDGDVLVDGESLGTDRWRRGGAGRRVLKRYLALLAAAHPRRLVRDQIADRLWPNSDGDRAINNLYAATCDLRDVLRGIQGVSLVCKDGAYGLSLQGNVRISTGDPGGAVEPQPAHPS